MRVGVVATSYPRRPGDAAGGFVAGHVAYLRAAGADVEVVAAGHGLPAPARLFDAGGAPDALEAARAAGGGAHLAALAATAGFSARMLATVAWRARRWDACAAHWLAPSAVAAALAPRRLPLVAVAHGGDVHLLARAGLLAPALALLVARDARLVFVSAELRARALAALPAWLAARAATRAVVQAMGVDERRAARIVAARAARGPRVAAAPATLAILARLVPVKAVDTALAALPLVRTPARLVVAGDGPARPALAAQARALGARVVMTGWLDADRRDELLARADVVLVPSAPLPDGRSEGTPLAALEALAAGVPVVASATGGLPALAGHGATLVPPRDPAALAAAIDAALARPPPPPAAALGWPTVGAALDAHWRRDRARDREGSYAPAPRAAQPTLRQWSSRPAASGDPDRHSEQLPDRRGW